MSRQARTKPANLTINAPPELVVGKAENTPPPPSSPMMNLEGIDLSSFGGDFSAPLMTLPSLPQSPPASPRVGRDNSKTFLNNFKSRLNSEQEQRAEPPPRRPLKDDDEFRPSSSSVSKIYHLRKNPGSTPELSLVGSAEGDRKHSDEGPTTTTQTPENKPQPPLPPPEDASGAKRREKGFRINPLGRTKSTRRDSNSKSKPTKQSFDNPPKTAPLQSEFQGSSEMLLKPRSNQRRGKSAERAIASESEDNLPLDKQHSKEKDRRFMTGSKNVMNKAKTGGGHLLNKLGKLGRTGSNQEKELTDSEYLIKVINLPLIEQTRITRISKDLGSCRDKTEYWMPSLPWRCIDYLNLNCESEGLYRVPGSGPQVKHWQRRFDTELDLDLLDEEELYDPNIVSSMLKSWLRDLPTEIMPKSIQAKLADKIQKENPNYQRVGEEAPQELRDALSHLPPFNYYLLFAITCHLSLLLSHKDKNKMDLNNLSICIGPCLDLDRWLFNYLVGDWRRCWQGCYTEKQFLDAEKAFEQGSEYEAPVVKEKEQGDDQSSQAPATDEKAASTTSRSGSRQQSRDDGGEKSLLTEKASPPLPSPPLPAAAANDALQPETSLSSLPDYSLYVNGAVPPTPERTTSLIPLDSQQRPATAQATESPKMGMLGGSSLKPKTPPHTRSQSDLLITPTLPSLPASPKPTSPADFPFKLRGGERDPGQEGGR